MAYTGSTRRFHLNTHKHIEELGLDLDKPTKLTTWGFRPAKKIGPRPYGEVAGLLWPAKDKSDEENKRMKHMFLNNIQNCWVRSVTEYPDKIEVIFW